MTATKAKPPAMSERDFQRTIIDAARRFGYAVWHVPDPRHEVKPGVFVGEPLAAGLPDLILAKPATERSEGRLIFAELKATKGIPSDKQLEALAALLATGRCETYIWWPRDINEAIRVLRGTA